MKEVMTGAYINGEETCVFNFYTDLSSSNKLKFVNSVVDILVDDEHYNSVIKDLIFDFYVVDIFTDVDLVRIKTSNYFLDDAEKFLDETNIVDIVRTNAVPNIFEELNNAVNKSIAYRTGIHPSPLSDAVASLVSTIEKKVNEIDLESMIGMASKLAGMTDEFTPENIMNAYLSSDIHKKNLAEIEETKKDNVEIAEIIDNAINEVNEEANGKTGKKK